MSDEIKTVVLLKPDAHKDGVVEDIVKTIESHDISIDKRYRFPRGSVPSEMLEYHYGNLNENDRNNAVDYMMSGDITALLCSGDNVIERMRTLGGESFDPDKCGDNTIRKRYSHDNTKASRRENRSVRNVIHTSDSVESAVREADIWFGERYELRYIDETIMK